MAESWRSRIYRCGFNHFPAYWGTGARITYIAGDWREVRVKLPLRLRTRNYVGTIFGGSMYGAVDPIYMIMLIRCLGPDYIVWDKAATICFKRPGRTTLFAHFALDDAELATIRSEAEIARSVDRVYMVELKDARGVVHATVEKTVYIRRKDTHRAVAATAAEAAPVGRSSTSGWTL